MIEPDLHVGVDIGGTFTDLIAAYGDRLITAKVPSTPKDPSQAVFHGLEALLNSAGVAANASVARLAHGTTVATNAAIERKGARVGLITTAGFEDVVEIGRMERSNIYDLSLEPETPTFITPRRSRIGVAERLSATGEVLQALDENAVVEAAVKLVERHQVEAIAIGFLFSFINPEHEQKAKELVRRHYPDIPISLSSEIDPRFREYERFSTTIFDAYLRPLVAEYLERLETGVKGQAATQFLVMQSSGGLCSVGQATSKAVSLLKSGLAGGVIGACDVSLEVGHPDIISVDIGGTSCDVALVAGGKPVVRAESKLLTYALRVPMVDVNTIGAGGGSIAWLDPAGSLHVGPHSAGSEPGPACYGRGGREATVTDASVVLGYLNPNNFAGGKLKLDEAAARAAVERIADPLGLSVPETALGIHRILNAAMADEIRKVSMQRGEDPRKFALVMLGGAGPIHGCELAKDLGITTLILPPYPGLLAAYGLLVSSISHDEISPFYTKLSRLALDDFEQRFSKLDTKGRAVLVRDGANASGIAVSHSAQMRYVGQSFELDIDIDDIAAEDIHKRLREAFEDRHRRVYGRINPDRDIEIVSLKTTHEYRQQRPPRPDLIQGSGLQPAPLGTRAVYRPDSRAYVETAIYDRAALSIGSVIEGPCILEQRDTTTIVPANALVTAEATGSLIISLRK